MDVETASAIEGVTDRIDTLGAAVREDIARLDTRVDALKTAVREDIARLDTRVGT